MAMELKIDAFLEFWFVDLSPFNPVWLIDFGSQSRQKNSIVACESNAMEDMQSLISSNFWLSERPPILHQRTIWLIRHFVEVYQKLALSGTWRTICKAKAIGIQGVAQKELQALK